MCFDKWDMKSFCFHIKKPIVFVALSLKQSRFPPAYCLTCLLHKCFGVCRLGELLDFHLFFFFFFCGFEVEAVIKIFCNYKSNICAF